MTGIFIMGKNYEFAKDGREIYDLREDKKHFHNYIKGKTVYAGRRTFDALPASVKKLPLCWKIYTRHPKEMEGTVEYFHSLERIPTVPDSGEAVCIGGAYLLSKLMEGGLLDRLVITKVYQEIPDADIYVPSNLIAAMCEPHALTSVEVLCREPIINAVVHTYEFPTNHK